MANFLDKNILLMGDSEEEIEQELVDDYDLDIFEVDILKAGHHGSKTASSEIFLKEVNPRTTVISCGEDNRFGHPSLRTMSRLQRNKTTIWRTDIQGDFTLFVGN